jgi:hypothetical protein
MMSQNSTMKSQIVANGALRLVLSRQYQARLRELRESIRARYSFELSRAGFLRRCGLHWRMVVEYRRERPRIVPSPYSL